MSRLVPRVVLLVVVGFVCVGCRTFTEIEIRHLKETAVRDAQRHLNQSNYAECLQILIVAARLDPAYAPLQKLHAEIGAKIDSARANAAEPVTAAGEAAGEAVPATFSEDEAVYLDRCRARLDDLVAGVRGEGTGAFEPDLLGSNRSTWAPATRSTAQKILLYLPDRILDLLDIFSFDVHVGPGLFLKYKATNFLQAGGGLRAVTGVGWHHQRSLGIRAEGETSLALLPVQAQAFIGTTAGTSGVAMANDTSVDVQTPDKQLYQDYEDYWGIGASSTLVFLGVEWEVHPLQIADFFAGWVGIDFLHDDFSHHHPLALTLAERRNLRELAQATAQVEKERRKQSALRSR